jgi:5'-phosphate synthase pdxT subunit
MSVFAESSCMFTKGGQQLIGGLDVTVHRNFFGRQIKSFEIDIPTPTVEKEKEGNTAEREPYRAVFIRAPAIMTAGKDVEILAKIDQLKRDDDDEPRDVIVAVKQVNIFFLPYETLHNLVLLPPLTRPTTLPYVKGNLIATAFHPELTKDTRWHEYFVSLIK